MLPPPDLLIALGPRAVFSMLGIFGVVGGVWFADRQWDEKGSAAYAKAAAKQAATKPAPGGKKASDQTALLTSTVEVPVEELNAAFPFPGVFLAGWASFGLSYFFPRAAPLADGLGSLALSSRSLAAAAVCAALSWIASVPMGEAVRFRQAQRKTRLGMAFVGSWVLLTALSSAGHGDEAGNPPYAVAACAAGAVSIIASMKILWKFRKMGDTWEQQGKPNPNPVVYNMGGPLFVWGWFLFWIGMAATDTFDADAVGIPLYLSWRTALAFFCGCGMVPIVMFLDYAHDEGAEFTGFGTDGRFFGRFLESPIPFILMWTGFGLSSWMPFTSLEDVTTRQWLIVANCVAQGVDAGVLIQTALYKRDMAGKTRYSIPFVLLFGALATELAWSGGMGRLAIPGAALVVLGQKTVFGDRKRGDYWMADANAATNPNPIVYSYGEIFFMTGWILMSLAIAIPDAV